MFSPQLHTDPDIFPLLVYSQAKTFLKILIYVLKRGFLSTRAIRSSSDYKNSNIWEVKSILSILFDQDNNYISYVDYRKDPLDLSKVNAE